jgi:hypothetical protein
MTRARGQAVPWLVAAGAAVASLAAAGPSAAAQRFEAGPGVVIAHSPASSRAYIGSPSLAVLTNGDYVASHDFFGPGSSNDRTAIFLSRDRGASWQKLAELEGQWWSTLFVHRGALYVLGTSTENGNVVIRRSSDGGASWTTPADSTTGLLRAGGQYHCAPVPVVVHGGRLWRGFERRDPPKGWGTTFCAGMLSAPVDADLLDAANWTCSGFLPGSTNWLGGSFGGWLEGNAVVTRDGKLLDILRVDTAGYPEKAALVSISADGSAASFDPQSGFINFPGGAKKFTIRYDANSDRYWSLPTVAPQQLQGKAKPASVRNTLALTCSADLTEWTVRCILLHHPDPVAHGFQYVDWLFDGDDLIAVCRTAYDDGLGGAHNYHDANFLTFHRVANFRAKTAADSMPMTGAAAPASSKTVWAAPAEKQNRESALATGRAPDSINGNMNGVEKQVTRGPGGRILTNTGVWSPDSEWIVYDTRSDPAGEVFDGARIEMVNIRTGEVKVLYESKNGAHCGAATFHPREPKVIFILGPEHPTPDWQYGFSHRQGVIVAADVSPRLESSRVLTATVAPVNLDARDLTPPFTPGALRGGSHVHVWDAAGEWVSFTYEDHVLAQFKEATADHDINLRNLGVSVPGRPVRVSQDHPRNHDGEYFSVLATRTTANPKPGSDEIKRAFEEGWVGSNGYVRPDGTRQRRALAFQGLIVAADVSPRLKNSSRVLTNTATAEKGQTISEVFIVDLPDDVTVPGAGPLAGTEKRMPFPPKGATQRRLTHTAERKFPGVQGPRHWLRSSPDGSRIAFLMKDDAGMAQLWTVSPNGGPPTQVTHNPWPVASAFTWSPDGRWIAHVMDNSVCVTDAATGQTLRLTPRSDDAGAPRPEACVFSPDGKQIAYVRRVPSPTMPRNQIFVCRLP